MSKMDGLVNLQNVLVVGMTNRKELLDEALLRPGRMEVRIWKFSVFFRLKKRGNRGVILGLHTVLVHLRFCSGSCARLRE